VAFTNAYHTTTLVIRLAKIGIAELAAESGAVNSGTIFYAAVYSGIYVVLRSIVAARACAGRRAIAFHRSAVAMPLTSARLCASVLPPLFAAGAQEHTATPVETS